MGSGPPTSRKGATHGRARLGREVCRPRPRVVGDAQPLRRGARSGRCLPGSAIDIAAGEGRNAIWLAGRGWTVTGCDYSPVAVDRMRELAAQALGDDAGPSDPGGRRRHRRAARGHGGIRRGALLLPPAARGRDAGGPAARVDAVREGGQVVVIGHAGRNLAEGQGGPSDRAVLYDPDEVLERVAGLPVEVVSPEIRTRAVDTPEGTARRPRHGRRAAPHVTVARSILLFAARRTRRDRRGVARLAGRARASGLGVGGRRRDRPRALRLRRDAAARPALRADPRGLRWGLRRRVARLGSGRGRLPARTGGTWSGRSCASSGMAVIMFVPRSR